MEIKHLLGIVTVIFFVTYLLLSKYPRSSYLLFVLFFLPLIDLNITPEEFGSISVFDFISYFILIFALKDFFSFSKKNKVYISLSFVLLGVLFIGCIKSEFVESSFFSFIKLISIFIYARILVKKCLNDEDFVKRVIKTLKLGCIVSLGFLLIQLFVGTGFTFYPDLNPNVYLVSDALRYPSFFQDPQKYAQYLSMIAFLFLMNRETKSRTSILNVSLFIIVILAILLTGARSALAGMCVGLLIVILFQNTKVRIIAFSCCVLVYFLIINFSSYFSIFNRTEDYSISFDIRNQIWKEGLDIFLANSPLFGIGIGNHHPYIVSHSSGGYYLLDNEVVYYGVESGYLQILIEAGILGFLIFCFFIAAPIIRGVKSYIYSRNFNIIFLIASVVSWMVAYITLNSLVDKRILVVLATLICLLIVSKQSPKSIHV